VHEDDALCLALACRELRDARGARCPARPAGHRHAGKRLRTRDAAVARLGARVDTDGLLDLSNSYLRALPEGVGRLAYLPHPGLRKLDLHYNWRLAARRRLLATSTDQHGLTALPEGIGRLAGLKRLNLSGNYQLTALPEGLCALAGLEELNLAFCELRALPAGLGQLRNLDELDLRHCPGLKHLNDLQQEEGLPALLAHLAAQLEPPAAVRAAHLDAAGSTGRARARAGVDRRHADGAGCGDRGDLDLEPS
jgi:hypothetical protein